MEQISPYIVSILIFIAFGIFTWKKPGWGLVLMPFVIAGIITIGIYFVAEETIILIIATFLFPVTIGLVRWAPSASPLETPWHKTFATVVMTIFQYLLFLAILLFVFNVFGLFFFLLFVMIVVRYKKMHKYSLALEILSAIGMSMRQSLPLPMALTTAAHGQRRKEALIFTGIAQWLSKGHSLSESLRWGYRKCPPELLASIAVAEKMDQLPKTIETLELDISEKVSDYKRVRPIHPWYPFMVALVAFTIVIGLGYFIVPTFAEILSDMTDGNVTLPMPTQILLNGLNWTRGRNDLNLLLIIAFPMSAGLTLWASARLRHRRPEKQYYLTRIGDWIKWHLPIVHSFECARSQLQLIEMLRVGLRAGYPVNTTIRNALGLDMNQCYRNRVQQWLRKIEQGETISDSARRSGIGGMLAWALDDTVNKGNAPMIFESLEEVYRSRYNYRLNLVNSILCPLMIITLGCGVGFVVTAIFLPMVKMIEVSLF